eukprot:UN15431
MLRIVDQNSKWHKEFLKIHKASKKNVGGKRRMKRQDSRGARQYRQDIAAWAEEQNQQDVLEEAIGTKELFPAFDKHQYGNIDFDSLKIALVDNLGHNFDEIKLEEFYKSSLAARRTQKLNQKRFASHR